MKDSKVRKETWKTRTVSGGHDDQIWVEEILSSSMYGCLENQVTGLGGSGR